MPSCSELMSNFHGEIFPFKNFFKEIIKEVLNDIVVRLFYIQQNSMYVTI